jgi:hypothetical protein
MSPRFLSHPAPLLLATACLWGTLTGTLRAQDAPPPPPRQGDERPAPPRERGDRPPPPEGKRGEKGAERGGERGNKPLRYSLEQALSDKAQLHTIAFSGLAFLSGDFAADTFLPPGKVSDYFGFQYLRDIDAAQGGHSTSFLTRIAHNMLGILTAEQRAQLIELGRAQQADVQRFAELRLPLMKAFRQQLAGQSPAGSAGLNREAVIRYSADLYELDGRIAWDRAWVMGAVLRSLSAEQKAAIGKLKFGDSRTWPDAGEPPERRNLPHDLDVALMTYASEMFAWTAGSIEADIYFCPERHGMYFGGFGMKTAPAMGKKDYAISTSLTGDSGAAFLEALTPSQRERITQLPGLQKPLLAEIVTLRRQTATSLRGFISGQTPDQAQVLKWSRRYGELDGEMSFQYASAFAAVGQSLSAEQKRTIQALRAEEPDVPKGPFLYSRPMNAQQLGRIAPTEAFFRPVDKRASQP